MKIRNENDKIQHVLFTDIDEELKKLRPGYAEYKKAYEKSFDFVNDTGSPLYIPFEVNDYCNMRCKMCWRSVVENPNGKRENIDMDLLDKFIRECKEINMPSFFLGAQSECLINPDIIEIIRRIREVGGGIDDVLITNGYNLTDEICEALIEYQWEKLFISLDAATPETYKKIRGRNLEKVENNIEKLLRMKKEKNSKLPFIRVSFVVMEENKHEMQVFIDKWKDKVDRIDFQTYQPQAEASNIVKLPETTKRCSDPFRKMEMDCHGNFYPCASIYKKYYCLGNIKDMSVEEAWNSEIIRKLREEMLSGNLSDVCKNCLRRTENFVEVE